MTNRLICALFGSVLLATVACSQTPGDQPGMPVAAADAAPEPAAPEPPPTAGPFERPAWLGTRELAIRANGLGEVLPTPPELEDRRLATPPLLPAPGSAEFTSSVAEVPADVAQRSTWTPQCPVVLEELRYVTVSFWGFDGGHHTGELLAHRSVAGDLVAVFASLHAVRFPIEEMRVVAPHELEAAPTGDGNNTTVFVCRPSRGSTRWSDHAFGTAIDINPFHNPYLKGDVVLPELASAYLDREWDRPGMIQPGDEVTRAFESIGWGWGGAWRGAKDWMHFSRSGR